MLEPNVRDYQGRNNPVNAGIRQTLNAGAANEFWWLNNGVTILAARSYVAGNKCAIDSPEVVNGLQTSYEIFQYFSGHPEIHDDRNVLVRVIVPPDEQMRSRIIKATNSQTAVSDLLLHATDAIHFDIEEKFRLYKLFYERRKGEYRELRKPVNQIISIHTLARAVMAILLRQPNDARGSPMRVLKNEKSYKQVFNEEYNRDVYVACILIQRQVDEFLKSRSGLTRDWRTDLRFYLSLIVACELVKSNTPTDKSLSAVLSTLIKPIDHKIMTQACQKVKKKYEELGATDRIAKGSELREAVIKMLKARFPK
jgi:hypothetical protein